MTYEERINSKANEIELLTAYANNTTGAADTNIGDAIKTLCDGYGQGSGGNILEFVDGIGDVVPNSYLESGIEKAYPGWSISKYYPAVYTDKLLLNFEPKLPYFAVYDESFNYVGKASINDGFVSIEISNAAYIRFSQVTTLINSIKVVRYKGGIR